MKWTWKVTAAVLVALSALLAAATARAGALTCAGDCDGDARVTIDEVLTMVGVALGSLPLDRCLAADTSGDHTVTVDEILAAIRYVPCGCAGCPTPSPTASETPTALPSATPPATFTPSDTPTLTPVPTVPTPGMILFREGWEKGKVGRYPIVADRPTFVGGDSGAWFVGDTVSSDPEECGVDHNLAEIVQVGGSKQLRLTSTVSGSSCADNIFAGPALVNPPQVRELNIPLGADVFLSFQVSADLQLDQRCNAALVQVGFDTFRTLTYVIQRTPDWDADPDACTDITFDVYLLIDPNQTPQVRNLWQDAEAVGIRVPSQIDGIGLEVNSGGSATFDDITVFRAR